MKTREELYCRIYKSLRLLRVTLVPNSQHVQKDVHVSGSRKSDDRENEVHQHRETLWPVTIVLIFESLEFHIPLLNKLKQIEKKSSTIN